MSLDGIIPLRFSKTSCPQDSFQKCWNKSYQTWGNDHSNCTTIWCLVSDHVTRAPPTSPARCEIHQFAKGQNVHRMNKLPPYAKYFNRVSVESDCFTNLYCFSSITSGKSSESRSTSGLLAHSSAKLRRALDFLDQDLPISQIDQRCNTCIIDRRCEVCPVINSWIMTSAGRFDSPGLRLPTIEHLEEKDILKS